MNTIAENLKIVQNKIQKACDLSLRSRREVTLIAVSKTKPVELIYEAIQEGQYTFGENKVQELKNKAETIENRDIHWHMIGHLQSNKVKYLPGIVDLIHSVENEKLALEIEKQAAKHDLTMNILCEVNVADEDSKYGLKVNEVPDFARFISTLPHISLKGLMTVAPYTSNPETNRPHFKELKTLMESINRENIPGVHMDTLSMGMSGDYEIAIQEGATMVRIGTAIFGKRS